MEPRSNEPYRQTHEPAAPTPERRLSAEELRERSVEDENLPGAVQVRQGSRQPPSEVREEEREHGADTA